MYFQYLAVFLLLLNEISIFSQINRSTGNDFLADGVNGRVGHLGKLLLEIVKQRPVLF